MTNRTATLTTPDETTLHVVLDGVSADIRVPDSERAIRVATEHLSSQGVIVDVR